MNAGRFAVFVRFIDTVATRRAAMGAGFAAGLANLLGQFGSEDVAARKKRKKKKCKGGTTRCGKKCVDLATDGNNCGACGHACLTGVCIHGACSCNTPADCGADCFCKKNLQGELACASAPTVDLCEADDDCPLGSFCLNSNFSTCTVACLT